MAYATRISAVKGTRQIVVRRGVACRRSGRLSLSGDGEILPYILTIDWGGRGVWHGEKPNNPPPAVLGRDPENLSDIPTARCSNVSRANFKIAFSHQLHCSRMFRGARH